ncbi:MAG: hypothetical protein ACI8UO_005334 [Verrucomicrobiales bacterium]|jgi:hypothetical protein
MPQIHLNRFLLSTLLCFSPTALTLAKDFEKPTAISAAEWWDDAAWLSTNLWDVRCDDLTNFYLIDSIYGTFEAWSDQQLLIRLREIQVISSLRGEGLAETGEGVFPTPLRRKFASSRISRRSQ